jgi:HK97 family phage prohead protease
MDRAYSIIEVKSLDEGRRTFSGWATTPEADRLKDTINPLGAKFRNPIVLLHQHKSSEPIGTVKFKKPTSSGIEFDAEIPIIKDAGSLKDRVDTAWGEIVTGLVRAVSIGFRSVKHAFKEDGGIDFQEIEIFELSTVSVPANPGAIISGIGKSIDVPSLRVIKSIDRELRAASGLVLKKTKAASGQIIKPSRAAPGPQLWRGVGEGLL